MSMNMNAATDTQESHGQGEQAGEDQADAGRSGEGAASAMAHMISRSRQQRHQIGEADDAAGSRHT